MSKQYRFRRRDGVDSWSLWYPEYVDGRRRQLYSDDNPNIEYEHRVVVDGKVVEHAPYSDAPIPDIPVRVGGYVTKDSGVRAEYASGMVRDSQDGKARYDLVIPETDDTEVPLLFALFVKQARRENRLDDGDTEAIALLADWYENPGRERALETLAAIEAVEAARPEHAGYEDLLLTRWAELMGRGAVKYGDRNWEKSDGTDGALDRARGSAIRHGLQWWNGKKDEDHAAAVCFNVGAVDYYQGRASS